MTWNTKERIEALCNAITLMKNLQALFDLENVGLNYLIHVDQGWWILESCINHVVQQLWKEL